MAGFARKTVGAALLLASLAGGALARDASWPMSPDQVLLDNSSDRELVYSVRAPGGGWADFRIGAGKSVIVSCRGCYSAIFNFSIKSETKTMNYDFVGGRHYRIFWNTSADAWDVGRVLEYWDTGSFFE
ncbi:hypothetical protein [Amaricoccus solimangrovi]|uniref:Uncharacterized protein n=1 Tax=Amaricoccus solimangrovi TaxID=2589815 RepID=A0A501WW29_9RHOB|nr:hypothetical protein [Amaricoccus solimangrovi]TPE53638.1 hypothetical protein FJM51_00885 [Amaricoccus solimangrovi]